MSFNFQCSFASDFKHGKTIVCIIVPEFFDKTKNCEWLEKNNSSFVLGFSGLLCVDWALLRVSSFSHQICGSFFNLTCIVFLSKPTVRSWWQCRGSYCSLALASVMKVIDNLWVTHWGLRWVIRIKTTHIALVSVWLELAEQYLQSVVLELSLQSQIYVTTLNILGIGWKTSVVGWSDSSWVLCTFMVSSDYDAELALWLLVGSMLLHFWVHITYLTEK
jgi:hypothetical protein